MSEIRRNEDGTVDEIVVSRPTFFHIEQMDDNQWWIGVDEAEGRTAFVLSARGKIKLTVNEAGVREK